MKITMKLALWWSQ